MVIADTDVLIDYLAGDQPARDTVSSYLDTQSLETTAVNVFELLSSAGEGKPAWAVRQLIQCIPVLPVDQSAAELGSQIRRDLERNGHAMDMADSLVAGIALLHGMPLLTKHRKRFERVEELRLIESFVAVSTAASKHPR